MGMEDTPWWIPGRCACVGACGLLGLSKHGFNGIQTFLTWEVGEVDGTGLWDPQGLSQKAS